MTVSCGWRGEKWVEGEGEEYSHIVPCTRSYTSICVAPCLHRVIFTSGMHAEIKK